MNKPVCIYSCQLIVCLCHCYCLCHSVLWLLWKGKGLPHLQGKGSTRLKVQFSNTAMQHHYQYTL